MLITLLPDRAVVEPIHSQVTDDIPIVRINFHEDTDEHGRATAWLYLVTAIQLRDDLDDLLETIRRRTFDEAAFQPEPEYAMVRRVSPAPSEPLAILGEYNVG